MGNKKLFESEVSKTLVKLGGYYYKPPDIMQAGQDKVDFMFCYRGRFVAIEAKQVKGHSCPPSEFSEGQKLCLRSVAQSGGLAVVLVNFSRVPLRRLRGGTVAWEVKDEREWLTYRVIETGGTPLFPEPGGTWSGLDSFLNSLVQSRQQDYR